MPVQLYNMVLKNTTSSGISIPDLSGVYIPASGTVDITDLFPFQRLIYSLDLEDLVSTSGIVISVEGYDMSAERAQIFLSHHDATYIQGIPIGSTAQPGPRVLEVPSGDLVVKYNKDDERIKLEEISFLSLSDAPSTYASGTSGYAAVVNSEGTGLIFEPPTPGPTFSGAEPPNPSLSNIWYNEDDNVLYYWDTNRIKWLSIFTNNYLFTYGGAADGTYMTIGNVSHDSAHYYMPRPACIVGVTANAQATSNSQKIFTLEDAATSSGMLNFQMTNWVYRSFTEDSDVDEGVELKCYIGNEGLAVRNPVVMMEVRWRYDPNA